MSEYSERRTADLELLVEFEQRLTALEKDDKKTFMVALADLLYEDPHQWSTRPCGTCRTASGLIGKPYGCYRYAILKEKGRRRSE